MRGLKTAVLWIFLFLWGTYTFLTSFFGVGYIMADWFGWRPITGIIFFNVPVYLLLIFVLCFIFNDEI